jgi:hypothetical protein
MHWEDKKKYENDYHDASRLLRKSEPLATVLKEELVKNLSTDRVTPPHAGLASILVTYEAGIRKRT